MADPLTALMYAVQVINFLKTLVTRTLRARNNLLKSCKHDVVATENEVLFNEAI
jgi:hypothetical protein